MGIAHHQTQVIPQLMGDARFFEFFGEGVAERISAKSPVGIASSRAER